METPTNTTTTVESLPNEVLAHIFGMLEENPARVASIPLLAPSPVVSLAGVSRRWQSVVRSMPRRRTGLGRPLDRDPFAAEWWGSRPPPAPSPPPPAPAAAPAAAPLSKKAAGHTMLSRDPALMRSLGLCWATATGPKVCGQHWRKDGTALVTIAVDGRIRIRDVKCGTVVTSIPLSSTAAAWTMTCAVSPSNNLVASGGGLSNLCTVYDIKRITTGKGQGVTTLAGHTGYVTCVRFIDDEHCVTCSEDTTCRIWDVASRSIVSRYGEHTGDVLCVEVSPANRWVFASCSMDKTVVVWDTRSKSHVAVMRTHEADVNNICWAESGLAIASASDDKTCRLYDVRQRKELRIFRPEGAQLGYCTGVSLSASGRFLFGACEKQVLVWDVITSKVLVSHDLHVRVTALDVSPSDGSKLATSCVDGTVRVWDPNKATLASSAFAPQAARLL